MRANVRRLREALGPRALFAVVKADGYGHGAVDVGRVALDEGAEALCVATLGEARALRDALPEARVIVMLGPLARGRGARGRRAGGRGRHRGRVGAGARSHRPRRARQGRDGHGPLGPRPDAAVAVGRTLADARGTPGPRLCGLMSHLATADETDTALRAAAGARLRRAWPRPSRRARGTWPTPPARCGCRRRASTRGAAASRCTASRRRTTTRPTRGSSPALRWTSEVAALRRLAPGRVVRATAGA